MQQIVITHNLAIACMLAEAAATNHKQRSEQRFPFSRPVTLITGGNTPRTFSTFSRDISANGIGLLHHMALQCGSTTLLVECNSETLQIEGEIVWCRPCGEGWYLSGVRFDQTDEKPSKVPPINFNLIEPSQ